MAALKVVLQAGRLPLLVLELHAQELVFVLVLAMLHHFLHLCQHKQPHSQWTPRAHGLAAG